MIGYATYTGTRRNRRALAHNGWRLLFTPSDNSPSSEMRFALDNGAWGAHQRGEDFNALAFRRLLERYGSAADWVVVPDIVGGGHESLKMSRAWLAEVLAATRLALIPVQDGMEPDDLMPLIDSRRVGIFVGGSTAWKIATLPLWGYVAMRTGCYLHVGRVNTGRRIRLCSSSGAHSFDGTSVSRFAVTIDHLEGARRATGAQAWLL